MRRSRFVVRPQARFGALVGIVLALSLLSGCRSDKKSSAQAPKTSSRPTLRILALGGAAGAIEPCGCVKDMLGGVDHAAALVAQSRKQAGEVLVLGAGPMFYQDPVLVPDLAPQADLKAKTMAAALQDLGLVAWAPGANDWAREVATFRALTQETQAAALAVNLGDPAGVQTGTLLVERAGVKIGLVGVSVPHARGWVPPFPVADATQALADGLRSLDQQGAELSIGLLALPRGDALRLVEQVGSLSLAIVGKPFDQGEANDTPSEPMLLGKTLVVQGQNHLQGVAVVDLFLSGGDFSLKDGGGVEQAQERASLGRQIDQLKSRLALWRATGGVSRERMTEKEAELKSLEQRRARLQSPELPRSGSYFLYDFSFVREGLGQEPRTLARLSAYYQEVNQLNRERFKDKKPAPVAEGESHYVGVAQCSTCHQEERAFWEKSRHARAYETLARDHKEFNLDCVSCHVTGYEKPGGSTVTAVENLTAVQCETCHGPGSRHVTNPADPALILASPSPDLCPTCHHTPHVGEDWRVADAWPHILGPGHRKSEPAAP